MTRKAVSFGLFALASLTLTFYIGAQIAHLQLGKSRYGLRATFDDATNLQPGDPVRLAGVPVGQVSKVSAVDGRAEVRFDVDSSVTLSDDSEVAVRWTNLIGQRELYLYPGHGAGRLTGGAEMTHTRSVVDLGALLNELGPLTQAVSPSQINSLVEALTTALSGNRANVNAVISDLDQVLATMAARKGTIGQLLSDYQVVTATVARRDREIEQMIDNLATLTDAFAGSQQVLDDALTQLPKLSAALQTLLSTSGDELGHIIDGLAAVTGTVHQHLGDVTTVLQNFPAAERVVLKASSFGQFLLINGICVSNNPPPCQHPVVLAAHVRGAGALDAQSLRGFLVEGET